MPAAALVPVDFLPWGLLLIVLAVYAAGVLLLLAAGRRTDARALAGFAPDCAIMIRRLAANPATPRTEKLLLLALVAYLISPIDLVPDFLPGAGQVDDAVLVTLALRRLLRIHGQAGIVAAWPGPASSLRLVLRAAGAADAGRT
jgi:uncharacterized membrane protein YkvA (DUF1232 family)